MGLWDLTPDHLNSPAGTGKNIGKWNCNLSHLVTESSLNTPRRKWKPTEPRATAASKWSKECSDLKPERESENAQASKSHIGLVDPRSTKPKMNSPAGNKNWEVQAQKELIDQITPPEGIKNGHFTTRMGTNRALSYCGTQPVQGERSILEPERGSDKMLNE